ncbi:MAG: ABC transporter ATP-binding protein/permease [Brachymonas sp.]|nr:ABC transporter ATP-binding protein/permease [Brachymonas sp.]
MASSTPASTSSASDTLPDPFRGGWGRFLRDAWRLATPYFNSEDKWRARLMLLGILALNLAVVYLSVLFNQWYNAFYNALQEKNEPEFWRQMWKFAILAFSSIILGVYKFYVTQLLDLRWRGWMTRHYMDKWLAHYRYYHLELLRQSGSVSLPDNPDQRIQEDIGRFTGSALGMSMGLLNASVTLVSFIGILWTVSGSISFTLAGQAITVPGYMVWAAVVYCALGSVIAHFIGRRLIRLNFWQEWREADFRYSLVRLREYSEAVAFDRGEAASQEHLDGRFTSVLSNMLHLIKAQKGLIWFRLFFQQAAIIFPFIVAAPRYFSGAIKMGGLIQISNAFGKVQDSLSWFVDSYAGLASWRATTERLMSFEHGVTRTLRELATVSPADLLPGQEVPQAAASPAPWHYEVAGNKLELSNVQCHLPTGKLQVQVAAQQAQPGDAVLVQGASGSGKSTLLRALADIWPQASGRVVLPEHSMFLPQRPYLPHGTLRAALAYPQPVDAYSDEALQAVLHTVRMPQLASLLDVKSNWSHKLSGGEQQRVAIARVLLKQPHWIFADEATSALDATTEATLYQALLEMVRANGGGLLSVAHRESVVAFHTRRWVLEPVGDSEMYAVVEGAAPEK